MPPALFQPSPVGGLMGPPKNLVIPPPLVTMPGSQFGMKPPPFPGFL